jgi:hypothetical protein
MVRKTRIIEESNNAARIDDTSEPVNKKKKYNKKPASNSRISNEDVEMVQDAELIGYNDLWMLRYDINDNGIGKILLPPSLSTLLQSDRVTISPSAGGLFIRSI